METHLLSLISHVLKENRVQFRARSLMPQPLGRTVATMAPNWITPTPAFNTGATRAASNTA